MISMNISPPRATAERNVESVPNVNARIRNSGSRNIGSVTRCSAIAKTTKAHGRAGRAARSPAGSSSPVEWPPAGRMP